MSNTSCHFSTKCGMTASTFVRINHSGRLCPLCQPCLETFEQASQSMGDDVKKNIPGQGEYTTVSLTDGSDEFAKQLPKIAS